MRINFNRFLLLLTLFFSTSLFASSLQEAKRNLDLGHYIISEYIYNEILNTGNGEDEVLVGLSTSLINQGKYQELLALGEKYSSNNPFYNRNIGYASFKSNDYQASYYYYNKVIKDDKFAELDISGRGWSAYYLGNYSLAYEDFKIIDDSELKESLYNGMPTLKQYWRNNYSGVFLSFNNQKINYNINYGFYYYNYSLSIDYNYNQNRVKDNNDREMITLHTSVKLGDFTFNFASMNAKGDFTKLYDGYGLALKSSYLMMLKTMQSHISLMGGYTYFEAVSSQQIRADISINNLKYGLSSGVSYLYLDYITPDYDKNEILYHASVYYRLMPTLTINYDLNLGKSNFAYNEYLTAYDNYDIKKLCHNVGLTATYKNLTIYLNYLNRDLKEDTFGTGVGYVF